MFRRSHTLTLLVILLDEPQQKMSTYNSKISRILSHLYSYTLRRKLQFFVWSYRIWFIQETLMQWTDVLLEKLLFRWAGKEICSNVKYFMTTHCCFTMCTKPESAYEVMRIYYNINFINCYMFRPFCGHLQGGIIRIVYKSTWTLLT